MQSEPNIPVIVIIGAGASLASGYYSGDEAPPLTFNLFDNTRARSFIQKYPMAQQAGRVIDRLVREEDQTLEQALLSLRESQNPRRRYMSLATPLFLQELLLRTSAALYHRAERYDQLIDVMSGLPARTHYVTLNYDTLLDTRLHSFQPLLDFNDYIDRRRNWSLIKLHGSVNWGFPVMTQALPFDPTAPPEDLAFDSNLHVCAPPDTFDLAYLRSGFAHSNYPQAPLYPALAVPEGPKDVLVAPPSHLEYLTQEMADAPQIDVLVLGYSALDNEVLELIKRAGTPVRRLTVVNRDAGAALAVYNVIKTWQLSIVWPDVYPGSFAEWIDTGGLTKWAAEYGGPYTGAIPPEQVEQALMAAAIEEQALRDEIEDDDDQLGLGRWTEL
jgi:hypothetical protein